jgi:hypothetical protein
MSLVFNPDEIDNLDNDFFIGTNNGNAIPMTTSLHDAFDNLDASFSVTSLDEADILNGDEESFQTSGLNSNLRHKSIDIRNHSHSHSHSHLSDKNYDALNLDYSNTPWLYKQADESTNSVNIEDDFLEVENSKVNNSPPYNHHHISSFHTYVPDTGSLEVGINQIDLNESDTSQNQMGDVSQQLGTSALHDLLVDAMNECQKLRNANEELARANTGLEQQLGASFCSHGLAIWGVGTNVNDFSADQELSATLKLENQQKEFQFEKVRLHRNVSTCNLTVRIVH